MKRPPRPCINCGTPSQQTRCTTCQTQWNRTHQKPKREHYTGDYKRRSRQVRAQATHCWLCGGTARDNDPWTADHVIAGDKNSPLAPAHRSCNSRRQNKPPHTITNG